VAVLCKDPVNFAKFPVDLVRAQDLVPPAGAAGMRKATNHLTPQRRQEPSMGHQRHKLAGQRPLARLINDEGGGFLAVYDASDDCDLVKERDYLKI
jgi:hypothetical protein